MSLSARSLLVVMTGCVLWPAAHVAGQPYYYQPPPDYYHNDTASGTVVGGAFGAVTGAILGGRKDRGEGALIGAGVGAVTGNLLGRAKDRADERQVATGAAITAHANHQAMSVAVSNNDLIGMTQAGVSEDVIISTMRSRGTRLDLSPQSLISLKQSGVSDRILLAAQDLQRGGSYLPPPPGAVHVVEPTPTTVIVHPAPWPRHRYYYHSRPYYRSRVVYERW